MTDLSGEVVGCCVVAREDGILFVEFVKVLRRLLTEKEEEAGLGNTAHTQYERKRDSERESPKITTEI